MNEYDTNRIYDIAKSINYKKTNELSKADCYVLNTCHIREKATDKVYHDIGRIKKNFKDKKKPIVIVTGCVAQAEGEALRFLGNYKGERNAKQVTQERMYLETMEKVLADIDKVIIDKNSGSGVVPYLPLPELKKPKGDS